jgi:hypothetical protein
LKGKDYPEKTRPELEYNVKLDLKRKESVFVDWIHRMSGWLFEHTATKLQIPYREDSAVISSGSVGFS